MSLAIPTGSDITLPDERGVLAGVVLRPAGARWDGRRYTGPPLRSVDEASLRGLPGLVRLVVRHHFVGIVAVTRGQATEAAARLVIDWGEVGAADTPSEPLVCSTQRAATADIEEAGTALTRRYRWPVAADATTSTALAWLKTGRLMVCADIAAPDVESLRHDLAALADLPIDAVAAWPSGSPRHATATDAAADAALLCLATGRPVRVAAPVASSPADMLDIEVRATRDARGHIAQCDLVESDAPWQRPSLARLLLGQAVEPRLQTSVLPPYAYPGIGLHAALHAAWGRDPAGENTVSAAHVFAHESFIDEAAIDSGADPVAFRLAQLDDPRGAALIRQVAAEAGWQVAAPAKNAGRGFAYACVVDERSTPPRRTWAAWVADVAVDRRSGAVEISRVVVGHDSEHLRSPNGDAPTIEAQVRHTAQRLLAAPTGFDAGPLDGADLPSTHLTVRRPPAVDLVQAAGGDVASPATLAWSDHAALPAAAAVANAIFAATGARLREPPFASASVRQALAAAGDHDAKRARRASKTWLAGLGGLAAAAAGMLMTASPWRAEIAPIAPPDLSVYSAAALERGRRVAAAGDCAVCHTAPGGIRNAGGRALDTPFGRVYSSNITPDVPTGIGAWSYPAFERAMRQGIHRDGRHLYPAFPYTAFAKLGDGDMQALYAHLMSQAPIASQPPETALAFPYSLRPLMAGWNLLFHNDRRFQPDPAQSAAWNRGAYLVQAAGHCGACHSPRNALGAEKTGEPDFLAGGVVDGWDAPALNALSSSPLRWTETDLFDYLRTGYSPRHGVAAGPMAPVVQGLAELPESDVRAIASYLASHLAPVAGTASSADMSLAALEARADATPARWPADGERIYQGACAACHEPRSGTALFGSGPSLAPNSNLHGARPDNLIQVILHGIAASPRGGMPGFGDSLNDAQVADLVTYLRARFGDGKAAWTGVAGRVSALRAEAGPARP